MGTRKSAEVETDERKSEEGDERRESESQKGKVMRMRRERRGKVMSERKRMRRKRIENVEGEKESGKREGKGE